MDTIVFRAKCCPLFVLEQLVELPILVGKLLRIPLGSTAYCGQVENWKTCLDLCSETQAFRQKYLGCEKTPTISATRIAKSIASNRISREMWISYDLII